MLGHVGNFVGHHGGQFAFRVGIDDHAAVYADDAARSGKGVDLRVVDHEESEVLGIVIAVGHQPVADGINEGFHFRIVIDVRLLADLVEKCLSQALFVCRRNERTRGRTDIRQVGGGHVRQARAAEQHQQEEYANKYHYGGGWFSLRRSLLSAAGPGGSGEVRQRSPETGQGFGPGNR